MKTRRAGIVICVGHFLLAISFSHVSHADDHLLEVLQKWGVEPGQKAGGAVDYANIRQPMVEAYPYWMANRFINDFIDEKTIIQSVEQEIDYSKRYELSGGGQKPWLPYDEVRDRHAKMAAPEYIDRYKTHIRNFVKGLSTRVSGIYRIGTPRYNRSTGMMHFRSRQDPEKDPVVTNLAYQLGDKKVRNMARAGSPAIENLAKITKGRRVGMLGHNHSAELVRNKTGVRIPMVGAKLNNVLVAFNKDLDFKGIKMTRQKAENFLNKYENLEFNASVNYKVKSAANYFGKIVFTKSDGVVFLADIEDVTIYAYVRVQGSGGRVQNIKKVFATLKASDFKPPAVTLATLKAEFEVDKKIASDKDARERQEKQKDIAALKQQCAKTNDVACYQQLCAKIGKAGNNVEYQSCRKKLQQINVDNLRKNKDKAFADQVKGIEEANRKKMDELKKNQILSACQGRYSEHNAKPWMPLKGTSEYIEGVDACLKEPVRDIYGPDILGLRLGMVETETRDLLRQHKMTGFSLSGDMRPFDHANLQWTKNGDHGIALFYMINGEKYNKRVAAVSRRLYFSDKAPSAEQAIQGLSKKYGKPLWKRGNKVLLWSTPTDGGKPTAQQCSGIADLLESRAGWDKEWKTRQGRKKENREQRKADRSARVGAQQACMAEHGMPSNAEAMQAFAQCMMGYQAGAAAPSSGGSTGNANARLPYAIRASGGPKDYAKYKACGAVTVAHINSDGKDVLKDMSLFLFDPDWIARQPKFSFNNDPKGTGIQF